MIKGYRVECRNHIDCGLIQMWFDTEEEAIEAWNRRTKDGKQE